LLRAELVYFRLQVLLLPLQARGLGFGEEADPVLLVLDFPLLGGVVEFDVASPAYFESAEFM
jgi:hypothetical protein